MATAHKPALLYLADPMCSWCWGFSPVIGALAAAFQERVGLRVIAGGLFPHTREPMDESFKAMVRGHWEHVEEMTGQPFNHDFFRRQGFVYDTEPACRALVTARELGADPAPLGFLNRLHGAFYRDNRDITDSAVLADLAATEGLAAASFRAAWESDALLRQTEQDFQLARELGMRGLPSLLLYDGHSVITVCEGYAPLAPTRERLTAALRGTAAPQDGDGGESQRG